MKTKTSIGIAFIVVGVAALIGAGVTYFQPEKIVKDTVSGFSFDRDDQIESADVELDFQTAKKLIVENKVGRIQVVGSSNTKTGTLHYTKGISGFNTEKSRKYLQDCKVEVKQNGDTVTISSNWNPANHNFNTLHIDFELTVPAELAVELENNFGEIRTEGLQNTVTANSDAGAVNINGFKGDLRVSSKAGEVVVAGGRDIKLLDAQTNVGHLDISLPADARLHIDAKTDIGHISNDFNIPETERHNLSGNIGDGTQGNVILKTNTGSIDIYKR